MVNATRFINAPIQTNGSKQINSSHPLLILSTIAFLNILLQKVKSCFTYKLIPTHDVFSFQYFFKCDTIHRIVIVSFVFKFITTQSHDFYSLFSFYLNLWNVHIDILPLHIVFFITMYVPSCANPSLRVFLFMSSSYPLLSAIFCCNCHP